MPPELPTTELLREQPETPQPPHHFSDAAGHLIVRDSAEPPAISLPGNPYTGDRIVHSRRQAGRAGALAVVAMGGATPTGSPICRERAPTTLPYAGTDPTGKLLPPRIRNPKCDPNNPLSRISR